MIQEPELLPQIKLLVADVLGFDVDEVGPDQNFFHDLGGESIDLIDLQFRVKGLGISVNFQDLVRRWPLDDDGRFTAETLKGMAAEFPFLKSAVHSFRTPYDVLT